MDKSRMGTDFVIGKFENEWDKIRYNEEIADILQYLKDNVEQYEREGIPLEDLPHSKELPNDLLLTIKLSVVFGLFWEQEVPKDRSDR